MGYLPINRSKINSFHRLANGDAKAPERDHEPSAIKTGLLPGKIPQRKVGVITLEAQKRSD